LSLEARERIIIPDEDGEEHLFEVLATFDVDETEQSYLAVIPVEQKEAEEVEVYAFKYKMNSDDENDIALFPIESDEEWDMVEEMLHTLSDEELLD